MVTKTFCDHCGNVTRNHKVLSFGDIHGQNNKHVLNHQMMQHAVAMQNATLAAQGHGRLAGGAGRAGAYYPPSPSVSEVEVVDVDLCQHCVPLWMNRVKAITKASDPE